MPENESPDAPEREIIVDGESGGDDIALTTHAHRIAWENYLRSLFLVIVIFVVGVMAWRPGLLRLSLLRSLANPSMGESLEWKPEEDPLPPLPEAKRLLPPDEWRLTSAYAANWGVRRPPATSAAGGSGRLNPNHWRRYSSNPWKWSDDAKIARKQPERDAATPPQKSESPFRVGNASFWPTGGAPAGHAAGLGSLPQLPPLPSSDNGGIGAGLTPYPAAPLTFPAREEQQSSQILLPPPLPSAPETGQASALTQPPSVRAETPTQPTQTAARAPLSPLSPLPERAGSVATPPVSQPPIAAPRASVPAQPAPAEPVSVVPAPVLPVTTQSAPVRSAPAQSAPAQPTPTQPETGTAWTPTPAERRTEAGTDWKNREITGPIPGAYLTIYPKLRFIGLCVPGQGYIRKYNQVGVPSELNGAKMSARDGRVPYGRYFIADRRRDADGPRLFLSWPSPDDARRIGVETARVAEIENAWRRMELPPQDTAAGGGVGLTGLRQWVEKTEGGFALEAPHMEEIYTALPDNAWVFVQE